MKTDRMFLQEHPIFSGLFDDEDLEQLGGFIARKVSRGDFVYTPGDPSDAVYWIKSGRVKVYQVNRDGREILFGIYHPGDIFGEMAFFENGTREHFAEARETLQFMAISRANMFQLVKAKPILIYRLAKLVGERRREIEQQQKIILYKDVRERLAGILLKLAKDHGIQDRRGRLLRFKYTHKELASLIGSSRETVSLAISDLRRQGVLDVNPDRKFIITNEGQLAQLT